MRAQGTNEWDNWSPTEFDETTNEQGANYQILDLGDWSVVRNCTKLRGKVIKFGQSIKYAGKQNVPETLQTFTRFKVFTRWATHNDVYQLRIGDVGIDRYIITKQYNGDRFVGILSSYRKQMHRYALTESIQILQMSKTEMIAPKNLAPGIPFTKYISNAKTSNFHGLFIDMIAEALEEVREDDVPITTDAEIAKTRSIAVQMGYLEMNSFSLFTKKLLDLLRENDGKIRTSKIEGFTHEEFQVFREELEKMTVIKINGSTIEKN